MHEEPLHLIPLESQEAVYAEINRRLDGRATTASRHGRPVPVLPQDVPGPPRRIRRRLGEARSATSCVKRLILSEKDRVGIGTFQPKDEKNQDSTELTGDLNYRKIAEYGSRLRPARLQLRRRAQHREPRHHRVHRDPEARRGLPLRPPGRVAGAQDQAQEVPADRHRRGHPRPHQRAGVPEAPEQRADGGLPRPHGEDRHPVQHAPGRTRSRSTPATSTTDRSRASTSPPTPSRWRPCGRC